MEASQWLYQIRSMPGGAGSAADPQEKINKYLEVIPEESREGLRSAMEERVTSLLLKIEMRSEIMVASLPQDGSGSETGSSDLMDQVRIEGL